MKQKLLNLTRLRSLMLLACVTLGMSAWGEAVTYTLTIGPSDFNSSSYAANNNEKTTNAVSKTDANNTYEVKWTSNQIMLQSDVMQWKKDNGYLYNSTDLGTINSVTVNSTAGTFTTYYGTSAQPSSSTTVGDGYFQVIVGNATGKTESVVVEFTIDTSAPSKIDPALAFSSQTASATIGQSFTAPTLTNTYNVNVNWSSSDESVATVSNGTVTLEGEGTTTITASYDGDDTYTSSSASYTLTVTDPNVITLWSEDFSAFSANDVPSGGTYSYACINDGTTTKVYADNLAGGTSPELLVSKKSTNGDGGSFAAVIPLNNASGKLILTYKTNGQGLSVSTTTDGITGGGSFSSTGTHTVTFSGVTTSMTSITIVFTATSTSNVRLDDIELRGNGQLLTINAPTFSLAEGTFIEAQTIELSCTTEGATIYYSFDNTNWTEYTEALTINETKTIYAKAIKGDIESEISSRTYTFTSIIDVATALATIDNTEVYVSGIISRVDNYSSNSITYFISDDGTTTDELEIYKGKGLNGSNFNAISDLQNGDVVVVKGTLTTYNDVKELKAGSIIISLSTKADPELSYATTSYEVAPNATFSTPELTNPHNLTITYSISENDDVATIDASTGDVTIGANEGTVTVTASFAGDDTYRPGTASYTISVVDETKGTIDNPYTIADVIAGKVGNDKYVKGYIVGSYGSGSIKNFARSGAANTNLALADDPDEDDANNTIAVQMVNNSQIKTDFNVMDKPYNIGVAQVVLKGTVTSYITSYGIKPPSEMTKVAEYVTVTSAGYATYYTDCALNFEGTGITASTATCTDGQRLVFVQQSVVPAETGVLLNAAGGKSIAVPVAEEATAITDNCFVGTLTDIASLATADGNYKNYILNNKDGNVGFYWANGQKVGAHRAYAHVLTPNSGSTQSFISINPGEESGIENVSNSAAEDNVYDLQGRRVAQPQKGLYIVNGKKVIIK